MAIKTVAIIVDDFSSRALSYPNVTYYDYGIEQNYSMFDDYYIDRTFNVYNNQLIDYGDVDGTDDWSISRYDHISQFYTPTVMGVTNLGPILGGYYYRPTYGYQFENYRDVVTFQEFRQRLCQLVSF